MFEPNCNKNKNKNKNMIPFRLQLFWFIRRTWTAKRRQSALASPNVLGDSVNDWATFVFGTALSQHRRTVLRRRPSGFTRLDAKGKVVDCRQAFFLLTKPALISQLNFSRPTDWVGPERSLGGPTLGLKRHHSTGVKGGILFSS